MPWYWVVYLVIGGLTFLGVLASPDLFVLWLYAGVISGGLIWAIVWMARSTAGSGEVRGERSDQWPPRTRTDEPMSSIGAELAGDETEIGGLPRYCSRCGEIFAESVASCPDCGAAWPNRLQLSEFQVAVIALTEFAVAFKAGLISRTAYRRLRQHYEARLIAARPARRAVPVRVPAAAAFTPAAPAPAIHAQGPWPATTRPTAAPSDVVPPPSRPVVAPRPVTPPKPPRPIGPVIRAWTARRQADLLLYLGAFLLTISAIIFINYQGSALTGGMKTGVFAGYTAFFLGLGVGISHWKRVKEAAPVFVGLGAVLTPLNFVVLWVTTADTDRQLSAATVWFLGSFATTALYLLLAWRGYGQYYLIPAAVSALVAWGSFAAMVHVGWEWFGAWYAVTAAVATYLATFKFPDQRRWLEWAGAALGFPAVAWAVQAALFVNDEGFTRWQLPITFAIASVATWPLAWRFRRAPALFLLPSFLAASLGATFWAGQVSHLSEFQWIPVWGLMAAVGFLAVAEHDRARKEAWAITAAFTGAAGLFFAHAGTADGSERLALPMVYTVAALGAAYAWARWRWVTAGALVPALVAGAVTSGTWAADRFSAEWLGLAVAGAGLGYIAFVDIQPSAKETWRRLALTSAALGIGLAHAAATQVDIEGWELAATYALVLSGALYDAIVRREDRAWLVIPAALAGGITSGLWRLDVDQSQWAWPALGIAAIVMLSSSWWRKHELLADTGWVYALVLSLAPLPLIAPYLDAPWAGAGAFAASSAIWLATAVLARGALAASLSTQSDRASAVAAEQVFLSWVAAAWMLGSLGYMNRALGWSLPEAAWVFAAGAVACWLAVAALGRQVKVLHAVLGPAGAASLGVAVLSALGSEANGQEAMMLGAAAAAATLAVQKPYAWLWRGVAAACAGGSLAFAHVAADRTGLEAWQLPAAYGIVVVALLWDSFVSRDDWAWLGIPAAASAGLAALLWWLEIPFEYWALPALGFALAIEVSQPWWSRRRVLEPAGWPYALALALTPLMLVGPFEDAPWVGAGALGGSAVLWFVATLACRGAIVRRLIAAPEPRHIRYERYALAWGATALLHGALAYANQGLGSSMPQTAWSFAASTLIAWGLVALLSRRVPDLHIALGPGGVASMIVAVIVAIEYPGHIALMLGAATLTAALTAQSPYRRPWQLVASVCGLAAIGFGHREALLQGEDAWQLPVAYGFAAAGLLWNAVALREELAWLGIPAIGSAGFASLIFVLGGAPEQWPWPALAFAALIVGSGGWWIARPRLAPWGWPYALALGLAPLAFAPRYHETAAATGAVAFGMSAIIWALAAWRAPGEIAAFAATVGVRSPGSSRGDRTALGLGSAALLFAATGFLNLSAGWTPAEGAWSFAALGAAGWLAISVCQGKVYELNSILLPAAIAATIVAALPAARDHPGQTSIMIAVGTAGSAQAMIAIKRWPMLLLVACGSAFSLAFAWRYAEWETYSLGLVYGACAVGAFAALTPVRGWKQTERSLVASLLSVLPGLLAFAAAGAALRDRFVVLVGDESLVTTAEWGAATVLVFAAGGMVFFEGRRLQLRLVPWLGTVIALVGAEMAIAMIEPATNQAYFGPLGAYVVVTALLMRRSEALISRHMDRHEALMFAGELLIVLPGARDALDHAGLSWSLWLIFEGFVLLGTGLAIAQRWLVVGGVLTIVGVAVRFYTSGGYQPPYWVTLGLVGALLVGGGLLLLAAREWWDRTRARVARWWLGDDAQGPRTGPGAPPAGGTIAANT
jgi:hypothetical protein